MLVPDAYSDYSDSDSEPAGPSGDLQGLRGEDSDASSRVDLSGTDTDDSSVDGGADGAGSRKSSSSIASRPDGGTGVFDDIIPGMGTGLAKSKSFRMRSRAPTTSPLAETSNADSVGSDSKKESHRHSKKNKSSRKARTVSGARDAGQEGDLADSVYRSKTVSGKRRDRGGPSSIGSREGDHEEPGDAIGFSGFGDDDDAEKAGHAIVIDRALERAENSAQDELKFFTTDGAQNSGGSSMRKNSKASLFDRPQSRQHHKVSLGRRSPPAGDDDEDGVDGMADDGQAEFEHIAREYFTKAQEN